ncbi:MAG: hypothetical protein A2W31_13225 [Planctomycetes bacterium RBG_16_64_10]|nr:MAG: hypothetical protein A2W31_13225 [Planctomycetes bacterium RBG_16_64_10]
MTVSFEMVLPGLVGLWLDRRVGTLPLLTLVGFGLGVTTAIWHLLQMTSAKPGHPATRGTGQRGDDGR